MRVMDGDEMSDARSEKCGVMSRMRSAVLCIVLLYPNLTTQDSLQRVSLKLCDDSRNRDFELGKHGQPQRHTVRVGTPKAMVWLLPLPSV